jgi:hypothetical protein
MKDKNLFWSSIKDPKKRQEMKELFYKTREYLFSPQNNEKENPTVDKKPVARKLFG